MGLRKRPRLNRIHRWRSQTTAGFTLLELLLVLLILGVAYGLAAPMLTDGSMGLELKAAARQVAAGLRATRSMAINRRTESVLTIDVENRTFQVDDDPKLHGFHKKLEVSLFTARSELQKETTGSIRFFPDGSSTGGRITMSAGQEKLSVDVDWLTGRVTIL